MMESEVTGNCHASFGERDRETRKSKGLKVRSVPTLLSPLLANIALHGLEQLVTDYARNLRGIKDKNQQAITCIRYADDFVILANESFQISEMKELVTTWLAKMGLELSSSKTRISHTFLGINQETPGFDFLGFNVRQYKVSKSISSKSSKGKILGFNTLIKPSKKAIKKHYDALAEIIDTHKSASQEALIAHLNPVISGWVNYYSTQVSSEIFSDIDHQIFQKLSRWANRRHPGKSGSWVVKKYWHTIEGDNWVFSVSKDGKVAETLIRHSNKKIVRHVKVKGTASPFDGNLKYWSSRRGEHPLVPTRVAKLLKEQKGKCSHCGLFFREDDLIEVDHIIPTSLGGKDKYDNLQALHRHCHDRKTANDGSRGTHNKG
jgi:RNA-directed DNA polymerase